MNSLHVSWIGLSESQVRERLNRQGYNELPAARPRSILALLLNLVREPMFLLLIACAVIYLLLGDRQEAILLTASVCVVMGITFYQEHKTERALEALRDLSKHLRNSFLTESASRRD